MGLKDGKIEILNEVVGSNKKDLSRLKRKVNRIQKDSNLYSVKKRELSRKNSISASRERPWKQLDEWIEGELEETSGLNNKELWDRLPDSDNKAEIYREGGKVFSKGEKPRSIKFQAFKNHVKLVKNKKVEGF